MFPGDTASVCIAHTPQILSASMVAKVLLQEVLAEHRVSGLLCPGHAVLQLCWR